MRRPRPPLPRHLQASPHETAVRMEALVGAGPVLPAQLDRAAAPHRSPNRATPRDAAPSRPALPEPAHVPETPPTAAQEGAPAAEAAEPGAVAAVPAPAGATGSGGAAGGGAREAGAQAGPAVAAAAEGMVGGEGTTALPRPVSEPMAEPEPDLPPATGTPLPPPPLPLYRPPDLTAIRAPILRPPPRAAQRRAPKVLADTGRTPSQHHADIQSALFRVAEAARQAQRAMVQEVESLATGTRFGMEGLAARVEGIVYRCTARVNAAARAASAEIERAAEAHIAAIVANTEAGGADMDANEAHVRAEVTRHLLENGSANVREAHRQLVEAYRSVADEAGAKLVPMASGAPPTPLPAPPGDGPPVVMATPAEGQATTFEAAGERIVEALYTAPTGAPGGIDDPYRRAYIDRAKAQATPFLAREHRAGWVRAAGQRAEGYNSAENHNRFVLASLGLVAPTAEAMEGDRERYGATVSDTARNQRQRMSRAQEAAVGQIERTLRGPRSVMAFFDPANPKSMPAKVCAGLRKTGAQMTAAMRLQGRTLEAGLRASVAGMAEAYPDLVERLDAMLAGDDLLDAGLLLPRIDAAGAAAERLRASHVAAIAEKAGSALGQARESLREQEAGLLKAADDALASIAESKLKALFEFELMHAFYTGEFTAGLRGALDRVLGYADSAARALLAPVGAAAEGGSRVHRRAVRHFNEQLAGEWQGYLRSVNALGAALGHGEERADASAAKPFPRIDVDKTGELRGRVERLTRALPEPRTAEVVGGLAVGVVAAPFSGGVSLAAGVYSAYNAWSSIPRISDAASALALPWPGALAIDAQSRLPPVDDVGSKRRVELFVPASDADKPRLLNLFSPVEGIAALGKRQLIEGATRLWGVHDDAVEQLAASFSPSELQTFSAAEIDAMQRAIRANLSGVQLQVAQAYINGQPSRAAAARILDELARARRGGDRAMQDFAQSMDRHLTAQLASASGAYIPPEQMAQFSDEVFIALGEMVPAQGAPGRSVAGATAPEAPAAPAQAAPAPAGQARRAPAGAATTLPEAVAHPGRAGAGPAAPAGEAGARGRAAGVSGPGARTPRAAASAAAGPAPEPQPERHVEAPRAAAAFERQVAARAAPPDPASVSAARERFLAHATRDYAQMQHDPGAAPMSSMLGAGRDDYVAPVLARHPGMAAQPALRLSENRRLQGGVVFTRMDPQVRDTLMAYVREGATSDAYREARAVRAMAAAEGRFGGASESDVVRLGEALGSPRLSLAQARLDAAEASGDAVALADARAEVREAERAHGRFLARVAARAEGRPPSREPSADEIARARTTIAARVNRSAASFEGGLHRMGTDLTTRGAIDLATGMRVSTAGWGTYDDLLSHVTANRRRSEFEAYFRSDAARRDGISRESLGIGPGNHGLLSFTETSGDQAQQLEIATLGVPETAADHADIAGVRARHQLVDGTGYISAFTMEGTRERENLLDSRQALAERLHASIQANTDPRNPVPDEIRALPPEALIGPDGMVLPAARPFVADRNGNLFGDGPTMASLSRNVELDAANYQAEIARQESFFTGVITALALVASIVLLLIPGVNLLVAGVLVAVLAGAATIAVKAGMRGGRYGWEEAAVDVARTGIEAATAGVGGALGGAVKSGTRIVGGLARLGNRINAGFGRVGGALVREGMVSAASGVANQALDDRIWTNGVEQGVGRLFKAGVRGAVTGGISGGLSEGIGAGLRRGLGPGLARGSDARGLHRIGARLGPRGADILQEAIGGTAGAVGAEGMNFLLDVAEGHDRASLERFLARIGSAGLRELLSSGGKAAARNRMKAVYHAERQRLMESDRPITPTEARRLRRLAISAGEEHYGRPGPVEAAAMPGRRLVGGTEGFRQDLEQSRSLLRGMPPALSRHAGAFSLAHLVKIEQLRRQGLPADAAARRALAREFALDYAGLDSAALFADLTATRRADRAAAHRHRMAAEKARGAETRQRRDLLADLPGPVRGRLAEHRVDAVLALPPALRAEARRLVAAGDPDGKGLEGLVRRAAALPDADPEAVRRQVADLVAARPVAEAAAAAQAARRRADLDEALPPALRPALAGMSDKDAGFLHRTLFAEGLPDPKAVAHVQAMLARRAPDLTAESLGALIGTALTGARRKAGAERAARLEADRARRLAQMDHVPEDIRPLMAHLPDDALLEIRLAQQIGRAMPQARQAELVARALRAAPGLDGAALTAAIARTLAAPAARRPFFERFRQRRALIGFVPRALRGMVRRTPILSVPDDVFAAYVRSRAGGPDMPDARSPRDNAVTMQLNGEVVVMVRHGAEAFALREEGRHVMQMHDPNWAARLGQLDEATLADWPALPVERQVTLARTAIDAEIAVHREMLALLTARAAGAFFRASRRRAAAERAQVEARLGSLAARLGEIAALGPAARMAIDAGLRPRPPWLDQPARLFNSDAPEAAPLARFLDDLGLGPLPEGTARKGPDLPALEARMREAINAVLSQKNAVADAQARLAGAMEQVRRLDPEMQIAVDHLLRAAATGEGGEANERARLLLDMIVQKGLLERLGRVEDGQKGFSADHQALVAMLVVRMAGELGAPDRAFGGKQALGNQIDAYVKMIDSVRVFADPALLGPARDAVAAFAMETAGQPGTQSLRNHLGRFLAKAAAVTGGKPLPVELLRVVQGVAVDPAMPLRLDEIADTHLDFRRLAEEAQATGLAPVGEGRRQIMEQAAFVEALTASVRKASPDAAAEAERRALALYPVYAMLVRALELGSPPVSGRARTPAELAVALHYASRLMHDVPEGRRLDLAGFRRLFGGADLADFRPLAAPERREAGPPARDVLDALPQLHALLDETGALHPVVEDLLAALRVGRPEPEPPAPARRPAEEGAPAAAPDRAVAVPDTTRAVAIWNALRAFVTQAPTKAPHRVTTARPEDLFAQRAERRKAEGLKTKVPDTGDAPYAKEPTRTVALDPAADPRELHALLGRLLAEAGTDEGTASVLIELFTRVDATGEASIEATGFGYFYVRIKPRRDAEGFTGFVGPHLRLKVEGEGDSQRVAVEIAGGERYVAITALETAVRGAGHPEFNFFEAMAGLMSGAGLPALPKLGEEMRSRLHEQLGFAACLMFGIEPGRHPEAMGAAVMAIFLGRRLSEIDPEQSPTGLMFGDPEYRTSVMEVLGKYFGRQAQAMDISTDPAVNALLRTIIAAQRNRIDIENPVLYPSAIPRFMEFDKRMNAFAEGTLDDPAARRFVESILLRYQELFDRAAAAVLPDVIARAQADGEDVESILQGAGSRDRERIEAFVSRVLAEMLDQLMHGEDRE